MEERKCFVEGRRKMLGCADGRMKGFRKEKKKDVELSRLKNGFIRGEKKDAKMSRWKNVFIVEGRRKMLG
jgi:hypothetical protein